MCDNKPMAPYAKLPELEEYKEWFKDFADLYREDGILQVTWKTNDGLCTTAYVPSCHQPVSKKFFLLTSRTKSSSSLISATAGW